MKAGLHNTSQFILEPKELKEAVKELYRKHLHDYDQVGREGREGRVEGHSLSSHDYDMSYTCYQEKKTNWTVSFSMCNSFD